MVERKQEYFNADEDEYERGFRFQKCHYCAAGDSHLQCDLEGSDDLEDK